MSATILAAARAKALEKLREKKQQTSGNQSDCRSINHSNINVTPCTATVAAASASNETTPDLTATQPVRPRKRRFQLFDTPPDASLPNADRTACAETIPQLLSGASQSNHDVATATDEDSKSNQNEVADSHDATKSTADNLTSTVTTSAATSNSDPTTLNESKPTTVKRTRWSTESTVMSTTPTSMDESKSKDEPMNSNDSETAGNATRRSRFQPTSIDATTLLSIHTTHLPPNLNLHQLCAGMTTSQADSVLTHLRYEAIQQQLTLIAGGRSIDEVDPLPLAVLSSSTTTSTQRTCRSPSPEPIYDETGKRTNTRLMRLKDRLIKLQKTIIDEALKRNPNEFRPPAGYKSSAAGKIKYEKKLFVPLDQYPDYNFKGVIIGARGSKQQELEKRTGCKIAIRGQGSWSDQRPESLRKHYEGENEPQHVWIQAETEEKLALGVAEVEKLLIPLSEEERRRDLQALAERNGWIGAGGGGPSKACRVCGALTHLMKDCPDRSPANRVNTSHISCRLCGARTHPTLDCPTARGKSHQQILNELNQLRASGRGGLNADERTDEEYAAFMAELFGGDSSSSSSLWTTIARNSTSGAQLSLMPPTASPPPLTTRLELELHHQQQQLMKESCREYTGKDAAMHQLQTDAHPMANTNWMNYPSTQPLHESTPPQIYYHPSVVSHPSPPSYYYPNPIPPVYDVHHYPSVAVPPPPGL